MVLPEYTPAMKQKNDTPRGDLIEIYFRQGYTYKEISQTLFEVHKMKTSVSYVKRILKRRHLMRRPGLVPLHDVVGAILQIIENSGQCLGYRTIWKRLTTDYGFAIQRRKVMEFMRVIDSDGVFRRKKRRLLRRQYASPGPNFVWHIDGYDKLKPFGFAIHGAIDGFSRRILWLEVGPSNSDPHIIARYYLDTVQQLGFCPQTCRCDLGTENTVVEEVQILLHILSGTDMTMNCFIYGRSIANQRIESWWSILRRQTADWWIIFFKDLRECNLFNDSNPLHLECIRYCFMDVLQQELNRVVIQWNHHTLQVKKNCDSPRGKPDILFFAPLSRGAHNHKVPCQSNDIDYCQWAYGKDRPMHGCSEEFVELALLLLPAHPRPSDVNEAVDLFCRLIPELDRYGN